MITFRLGDRLPRTIYEKAAAASVNSRDRYLRLEKLIDQGRGSCLLGNPRNATIVRDAPVHSDGEWYRLLAWVVIPNHVQALIEQVDGYLFDGIFRS
jgi:hypothetical protein